MSENFRLSVSKVKTFNQCKKQYEFNYILKFPKKERDYHVLGKFCHRVLEWFHFQYIEGSELPYNSVMTESFKVAWSEFGQSMSKEMKKEAWDWINQYLMIISKDKLNGKPFNVISVERNFSLNITDNIVLNGAIDRVQLDSDGVLNIADYKTTKNKKYLKEDWFQLLTYAYVILQDDPSIKKIRGSYILLRHDFEYITKDFYREDILKVKNQYIDYANKMVSEKEFEPNPTILCSWCDYLEFCEIGREKAASNPKQSHKVFGEVKW